MNQSFPWRRFCLLAVFVLTICTQAGAAEPDDHAEDALRLTTAAAERYEFRLKGSSDRKLDFYPKSILRWSNPVAGEIYGNVFVWTHDGRPQVIGSIYQWYSPETHGSHEFHSLAGEAIEGRRDDRLVWTTPAAGVRWEGVPDGPPVNEASSVRLRQARSIARKFSIEKTDRADVTRQLRMLAQPIYQYGDDQKSEQHGMVFVFVQGTDPEVFLLIEATKGGWQYALARMNSIQFVATYDGQEVWRRDRLPWAQVKNGMEIYNTFGPFQHDTSR